MNEFALINKYFAHLTPQHSSVVLGIGDDAAIVSLPPSKNLVITTDTLVEGVHFLVDWSAAVIAHRALAVNLSDLAAMGAEPCWATLALTMPVVDESWLQQFSEGFAQLAKLYQLSLIGGNVARGPLNITLTLHGTITPGMELRRDTARAGDAIYVTGPLGGAALALLYLKNQLISNAADEITILRPLLYPQPRITHGLALAGVASSAIDISDGLKADLGHILDRSQVGAALDLALIPVNPLLQRYIDAAQALEWALSHSDDYELCFTVNPANISKVERLLHQQSLSFTRIGTIESQLGLRGITANGSVITLNQQGYQHF